MGGVQICSIICNLFLVQSWVPKGVVYFSGNAVSWCLSDLFFFYALLPFVIRLLQNRTRAVFFTVFYFCVYGISLPLIPKDYVHAFVYINPLFRFADFYIGILLCKFYEAKKIGLENRNLTGICFQILSVAITVVAVYAYQFVPEALRYSALFFVPSALVILAFSLFENTQLAKIMGKRPFVYLGEISFTFYMLHALGIAFVNIMVSHFLSEMNFICKSGLQFAFILVGSAVVRTFYEKPVAKKLLLMTGK